MHRRHRTRLPLTRPHSLPWLLCWLMAAWLACWAAPPAWAQSRPAAGIAALGVAADTNTNGNDSTPLPSVDELRKQLNAIPNTFDAPDDGRKLLTDINAIGEMAERVVNRRTAELVELDKRLDGLGPAPEKGSPADAPDVVQQRALLNQQRSALDSELKLARLVSVDAAQRSADVIRQRRAQFHDALAARSESPLSPRFWRNLHNAAPRDMERLKTLGADLGAAIGAALDSSHSGAFFGYLALAVLLAVGGPWMAERVLVRALPARLPGTRLRRSLLASAAIVTHVFLLGTALQLAWSAVQLGGAMNEDLRALQQASLRAVVYASFVIALGHALLSRRLRSWRLLPLPDALARRLSGFPWWIATLSALGGLMSDINAIVGASLSAEVAVHGLFALLMSLSVAAALRHMRAAPPTAETDDGAHHGEDGRPLWLVLILAAAGLAVTAILLALILGYVALAGTLARQMVWAGVVFASAYLLMQLSDDLCDALLSSKGAIGARIHTALGLEARLLDQVAVVVSGLLHLLLLYYMAVSLMAPLGTDPDELFRRGSSLDHSLQIGDITLAPQALLTALAVVCAGFLGIRLLKHWLAERYFPHTSLEPGMRISIVTLLGYAGAVVVVAVALAGLGISVERIAWVASALTVGIGFGLQAIVQNFISGLILLAEQPVKVGDWVVLGDNEGDVRRVNVRATEIQLGDKSTLIVPNSEFITKTVRNMTLGSAQGRVLLRLPAPLDTDARRMRALILQAFQAHEGVLDSPAPSVTLEGIQSGTLTFLAIGYVSSPRQAAGVRSEVLFAILEALRDAGLTLSPPATTTVAQPLPSSEDGLPTEKA